MSKAPPARKLSRGADIVLTGLLCSGFGGELGCLSGKTRDLVAKKSDLEPWDVAMVAVLTGLALLGGFIYNRCYWWLAIHAAPVDRRPPPANGPTWTDLVWQSPRLAWAMLLYAALLYLSTAGVWLTAIEIGRRELLFRLNDNFATIILVPPFLWGFTGFTWGIGLFRGLARGWVSERFPGIDPASALYDREMDDEFAPESRPVS